MLALHCVYIGGEDLHELHLHGHVDGEEHPHGVRLSQDQGVLQRKAWTRISGIRGNQPVIDNIT